MTKPAKILIVEDEQVVAMDSEAQLVALGYDVVGLAATGREALRLAGEMCPDLVLMDIQLQGALDGIDTATEIRRRWQIPVVFVTAYAGEEMLTRAQQAGPYGYITKPFKTQDLHATTTMALEQHRLTQDVFQEHSWLRTVLAGITDGVIATDLEGRIRFLNAAAEALTGWTLARALGQPIEAVYPLRDEDGEPLAQSRLRLVLASNRPTGRQRFQLFREPQQLVLVEDTAAPIHNALGELAGAVTVIIDVTERYRAERERDRLVLELARSNAELARFSYTVSHDLQAPVRTVKGFTEVLARQLKGQLSTESAECLGFITSAATGMQRLIQALLEYARAGQASVEREEVPVGELLLDVQRSLAGFIADTQAQITLGPLPSVSANRVQLQQVFQNLVGNALHYRIPGQVPHVFVAGDETAHEWIFSVADQGIGIPSKQLERVFAPLTRLHGPELPGTGIGLALCRTIVERHGGHIWAESAGENQGTTVRFSLPRGTAAHLSLQLSH